MTDRKQINFRCSDETLNQIKILKSYYKKNTSELMEMLILKAYTQTKEGHEELKDMINELNKINKLIDKIK